MFGYSVLFAIVFACIGYLLGSVLAGVLIGKMAGIDPRNHGSKGAGATNVSRTISVTAGVVVMLLDAGKTMVAVAICYAIYPALPEVPKWLIYAAGVGAVVGHCFPLFFKFKGGKGVACMGGLLLIANPTVGAVVFGIWVITVLAVEYVSVGSLLCSLVAVPLPFVFPLNYYYLLDRANTVEIAIAMAVMLLIVFLVIAFQHRKNIGRVLAGNENRAKWPGKVKRMVGL